MKIQNILKTLNIYDYMLIFYGRTEQRLTVEILHRIFSVIFIIAEIYEGMINTMNNLEKYLRR